MGGSRRRGKRSSSCSSISGDETCASKNQVKQRRHIKIKKNKPEEFSWLFALTTLALLSPLPINEILNTIDAESTMYNNFNEFGSNLTHNKPRPGGIRYRDDGSWMQYPWNNPASKTNEAHMVMPLMTERPHAGHLAVPSRSLQMPTTSSDQPHSSRMDDPSLEDFELIDVLWRSDIADEKGASQMGPTEQFENDLQVLTEKSMVSHLSAEETSRYEDLAKSFFEDFYYPGVKNDRSAGFEPIELKRNAPTPTDEDLDALLEDVTMETSELNRATQTVPDSVLEPLVTSPLLNNVTLGETVYTESNVTEFLYSAPDSTNTAPIELYNTTQGSGDDVTTWTQLSPRDVYPTRTNFSFPPIPSNETDVVVSTGVMYDHSYQSENRNTEQRQHTYDSYYESRTVSFSNESSSMTSTSSCGGSPRYNSEAENHSPISRYFGKLAPKESEYRSEFKTASRQSALHTSGMLSRGRRGRQSKDEQLAASNNLPVSANDIAEMALADLQKLLKNEKLNEYQKNLIRKIRRRGKNKVAARTCRQRRHTGPQWTSLSHHLDENLH